MKKLLLIPGLFLIILFLFFLFPKKGERKYDHMEANYIKYTFYDKTREERYKKYQEKNPNLKDIDIITRVNLDLDFPPFSKTSLAYNIGSPLVFVNKYHYLQENYVPESLETVEICSASNKLLVKEAKVAFEELCKEAKKENLKIRLVSSYRSFEYQQNLYNSYKEKDGEQMADTYSARAGFSEHQTGLSMDIDNEITTFENFEETKEFEWMQNNAHHYGFILRYPKGKEDVTGYTYESWHYRYVGKNVATYIKENDLTLDEYIARSDTKKE